MSLSKNDLCEPCRKIRRTMDGGEKFEYTVGEELDLMANNPMNFMFYGAFPDLLKQNGGCSACVSMARRAVG